MDPKKEWSLQESKTKMHKSGIYIEGEEGIVFGVSPQHTEEPVYDRSQ